MRGGERVSLDVTENISFGEHTIRASAFYNGWVETILGERGLGQFERVMVGCGGKEAAGAGFEDDTGVGGEELDTALSGAGMAISF